MNKKDLDALNELYSSVYSGEQLDEAPAPWETEGFRKSNAGKFVSKVSNAARSFGNYLAPPASASANPSVRAAAARETSATTPAKKMGSEVPKRISQAPRPTALPQASTPSTAPRPAASSTVLAKQKGVEGKLDKATGKFTAGAFSGAEKSRYSSVAVKNAGTQSTTNDKEANMATWAKANKNMIQNVGTSSQKAILAKSEPLKSFTTKPPTPGSGALANAVTTATAKPLDTNFKSINNTKPKPTTMTQSYEWSSAKTLRDIAGAYNEIYEAKKKVDQDEDGDNDFADVRVARMIASGVPKAKAIAMVKNKSYNEEVELWVNELLEEGYDLSEYTWEDMFEIYEEIEYIEERDEGKPGLMFKKIAAKAAKKYGSKEAGNRVAGAIRKKVLANEATAMTKRGYDETEIRNKIAKSTGGGKFADKATELENRPTFGDKSKQASREKLARTQRGDFRRTNSSDYGLRLGAHKSNDPAVKAKQAARGKQRSPLTPKEKKQLNREAYEAYEFVSSYLLENNFATTVDDANVIINNMSEGWFESIMEEKKPLPIAKMKRKETKFLGSDEEHLAALKTPMGSPERKKAMKNLEKFDNINTARTSISKRGGKEPHPMPEVGRYKPKYED